ncbi:hypothetical protein SAMD00019534_026690 [Acytostelium subglobosum LB1]|uniref:hypothetical protein n=1 Tax=Acytostelium subglobosum LB1 TaxID=1410327 RepID=UPI000644A615|nr:hypothetical protein SAMD00019534_026690 [Acytostelium subglobosum LB1]GAM19494.1 hypothetical protein SAMD00019534_026690 [Acytostelium subglobosum LB1]|eukprot:XP_012757421.1 hypothetical protein SAMD00019534_026690 [Acytostelium subglobosum LB1]
MSEVSNAMNNTLIDDDVNNNGNNNNYMTDEQTEKLNFLERIRSKERDIAKVKSSIYHENDTLKTQDLLLDELLKERNALVQEHKYHEAIINDIQSDIKHIDRLIKERNAEKTRIQKGINNLHDTQFSPLKDSLDEMRRSVGLPPLPSFDSERTRYQTEYLTQRLTEEIEYAAPTGKQGSSSGTKRRR